MTAPRAAEYRHVEVRRLGLVTYESLVTLLLAIALLAPLVVVPGTFFPYVVPRNILFRVVVELGLALRISQILLGGKRLEFRGEYALLAITAFVCAISVSALFSAARAHSFFGDFERMGGVWAWLHLAGFLFLLRTIEERHLRFLLHVALAAGVSASVHAIVERLSAGNSLTLLGNSGLLAGYLLLSLGTTLFLATGAGRYRWLYLLAAVPVLVAILGTQNRSSAVGLIAGGLMAALALGFGGERRRWIPLAVTTTVVASLVALLAIVRSSGSARFPVFVPAVFARIAATKFDGVDALRSLQWNAALAGFRDKPVLGFGAENHHLVWSAHFDPRSEKLGMEIFDRAHNQYLELLATTGIVGTAAFFAIWAAIGYSLYRAFSAGRLTIGQFAILAGVNVAYTTYLAFWFVDMSAAIVWLLLAALIAARFHPIPVLRETGRRVSRVVAVAGVGLTASLLAFILHRHAYIPLRASMALATLDSSRDVGEDAAAAVEVIAASPSHQTSYFGPVLSRFIRLANGADSSQTTGTKARRDQMDRAFQVAISAFDAELRRDPLNDRLHTAAAELLIEAGSFYDSVTYLERAILLLERAVELNPDRSQQRRMLAKARAGNALMEKPSGT